MKTTPKKEASVTAKRTPTVRQKTIRQNVKSRAIVSTDPSSSDEDDDRKKCITKVTSPTTKEIPIRLGPDRIILLSPLQLGRSKSPRGKSAVSKITASPSGDDDEDDNDDDEEEENENDEELKVKLLMHKKKLLREELKKGDILLQ